MRENGAGKDCVWPPKSIGATASRRMSTPRLRITAFSGGRDFTGLTSTRSVTAPITSPEASAITNANQYHTPCWITTSAMYVVNIAIAPWA